MARSPYTGEAQTEPEIQAPDDYQRLDATSASFGGQVAQGAEEAGAGALKAADFYNQAAASQGVNNFLETRSKILTGDPGQGPAKDANGNPILGPGGAPIYNGGFLGLRGQAALDAAPEVTQQLKEAISDTSAGLHTPASRLQFQTESRRYLAQTLSDIGQHTDQQSKIWYGSVYDNQIALRQSDIAHNPTNSATITSATDDIIQAIKNKSAITGDDPSTAVLKGHQLAADTQVKALLLANRPADAYTAFNANSGLLASMPGSYELGQEVQSKYFDSQETPIVRSLLSDALTTAQAQTRAGSGIPGSYVSAVSGRETDHLADAATAANPRSSARGTDQFIAGTWYNPEHPDQSVMGQPEFAADIAGKSATEIEAMRTDATPQGQLLQQRATSAYARMNAPQLQADGVPVNAATLGMAHGYGAAGAAAIFNANPDTPMASVVSPSVLRANPELAHATAGQVVQQFTTRFGNGTVGSTSGSAAWGYSSTADALRANWVPMMAHAQTVADAAFPNDPGRAARVVDNFERQARQTITAQDDQGIVDAHSVQSEFAGPNPPKTQDALDAALAARGPGVAGAAQRLQFEQPLAGIAIQNRFAADDRGRATGFGTQGKDFLDRVLAPQADPSRISNPMQLNGLVGPGDDASLTNTGADAFSDILSVRGGPGGEAFAAQAKAFIDQAHQELTFSNPSLGRQDINGEKLYNNFLTQAVPALVRAQKAGTLADVLNPKSPNYLGLMMQPFVRTPAQMLKDQLGDQPSAVAQRHASPAEQGYWLLKNAVLAGRLTPQEAARIGNERGYRAPGGSSTPGKPATAPVATDPANTLNLFSGAP